MFYNEEGVNEENQFRNKLTFSKTAKLFSLLNSIEELKKYLQSMFIELSNIMIVTYEFYYYLFLFIIKNVILGNITLFSKVRIYLVTIKFIHIYSIYMYICQYTYSACHSMIQTFSTNHVP